MAKETVTADTVADLPLKSANRVEEAVLAGLIEEDVWKISQESLTVRSWTGVRLSVILFVQGCNQAGYGVDWAKLLWGFRIVWSTYGLINTLMQIGIVCGAPFLALSDIIGPRSVDFIGNLIIIATSIMQATAPTVKLFMAGRFLVRFGSTLLSSSQYMGEISPVHLRGLMVGIFGACFQIGRLCMAAAMIDLAKVEVFPTLVCLGMYTLCPESARYYIMRSKRDTAKRVTARYHSTSGDLDQPISFWDYSVFPKRTVRYRLLVLFSYSIFQQME
ncbi:major facilitator superfamily domain-containing protein [Aspergillus egyptiacus]|nr:major facilitator superfamily domain-containing protein [Aspergillus egyptiacus]